MTQLGSKKSRKGCTNCKKRRVKCNEQSPCANCARRGELCSLTVASPSASSDRVRDDGLPATTEEWLSDMELMYHYNNTLSKEPLLATQIQGQDASHLWRDVIPQEGLKHAFLLHGLLALSALNLAYLHPTELGKYMGLFDKHQTVALSSFRDALSGDLSGTNGVALFALAALISASSMARSAITACASPPPRVLDMEDVAEVILLTRGVRDVTVTLRGQLMEGPMAALMSGHVMPDYKREHIHLPESVTKHWDEIQSMLTGQCSEDLQALDICSTAWNELKDIYLNLRYFKQINKVGSGQIWRWPATVPYEFAKYIQAQHPPTLVIVAHFAAATSCLKHWWVAMWGQYAMQGIVDTIDDGMKAWLEWPRRQMEDELAILLT